MNSKKLIKIWITGLTSYLISWRLRFQCTSMSKDTKISNSSKTKARLPLSHGCVPYYSLSITATINTFTMKEMTLRRSILWSLETQLLFSRFSKTFRTFKSKKEIILELWTSSDQYKKKTLIPMNGIQESRFWKDSLLFKQRMTLRFLFCQSKICTRCNKSLLMLTMNSSIEESNVLEKDGS